MSIPTARLGDLTIPAQGFGGMALADVYGVVDRADALATLHHAVDRGIRLIDTADVYGRGDNERLVARLIADRGSEIVVATKFGILPEPDADGVRARGDREYVRSAVQASLTRLGVERLDLYYYHRVDPRVPIEDTVGALAELVAEGLVARIGLSEVTGLEFERAHAVHPITAVQSEWSIWSRDVEEHVVPTAARLGVAFVAYSPLGRGFLAGSSPTALPEGDLRRVFPRFAEGRVNAAIAERVREIAAAELVTPAQAALAWVYARAASAGVEVVPIPSTRRAARVDENLAATGIRLSDAALAELDTLAALVDGERAPDTLTISRGREQREHA